jgi:hypothetical protein
MNQEEENLYIQQSLAHLVVEKITGLLFHKANATVGPLVTNYFSFIFFIEIHTGLGLKRVFVKIPKENLLKGSKSILPISSADQRMAEDEVNSLQTLADKWHSDDLGVSWVRFLGFFPQYNAIVTNAAEGDEALTVFRQLDLRRRLGSKRALFSLRGAMGQLGEALGRFHQGNAVPMVFRLDEAIPKLERYCQELGSNVRSCWPSQVIEALKIKGNLKIETMEVSTLKGIDIRNVIIDGEDRIFLFDPGRMKRTCREADLARFIMTYRILYWGSGLFLLGLRPDPLAEAAFLEAYYANSGPPSRKLLSLFLIKEQLKHWHTAIDSLRRLQWVMPLNRLVEATYINPYYTRQLAMELRKVI